MMGKASPRMKALAIVPGAVTGFLSVYWFALRPWHQRWGATHEEVEASGPANQVYRVRPMVPLDACCDDPGAGCRRCGRGWCRSARSWRLLQLRVRRERYGLED